ncbi:hypothetical protein V2J09_006130 [Rumex salicifolius]
MAARPRPARSLQFMAPESTRAPPEHPPAAAAVFLLHFFTPFSSSKKPSSLFRSPPNPLPLILSLLSFLSLSVLLLTLTASSAAPCFSSTTTASSHFAFLSLSSLRLSDEEDSSTLSGAAMVPLPARWLSAGGSASDEEREFWRQPDDEGFRPCLDFSVQYRRESPSVARERRRFLVVVVSGGLNQQRNQIVDAVVIARILRASLVIPVLQVNLVWRDESEFSDIFDVQHFKKTLESDVRVVSSLPSTHLLSKQSIETQIPFDVSPLWIRTRFSKQLFEEGLLVLKGLDSRLSKNLPSDLQKLRCKVAFHALRFAGPIQALGARLARRMWIEGPYIAVHLRLEKDVWVRTGCRTGLGTDLDLEVARERATRPEYLTGRVNMSYGARQAAGLCPLTAGEVARLLRALGAPRKTRLYVAGGDPMGGFERAVIPLAGTFPNVVTKETLAKAGELAGFTNRSSALAALDYIVALSSDVFLPSHGGNMGRAMQGHRAYSGHRKFIKPNKRMMLPFLQDKSLTEAQVKAIMKKLHEKSVGQVEPRLGKRYRDVLAYPVPECMCKPARSFTTVRSD